MSKDRLEKLLGMLGSDFDGERAAAALKIANLAKAEKQTIPEYVAATLGVEESNWLMDALKAATPQPSYNGDKFSGLRRAVHDYPHMMTDWEQRFADDILYKYLNYYELSDRQKAVVDRILRKTGVYA